MGSDPFFRQAAPDDQALQRLVEARHHDPFEVLGRHRAGSHEVIRAFFPGAERVIVEQAHTMRPLGATGVFQWCGEPGAVPERYKLSWTDGEGHEQSGYDPYAFAPQVGDLDLHLFAEGRHLHAYRFLGAHPHVADGIDGVLFATWAPNAERVSVVGDFNAWDGRRSAMRVRGASGVWELFLPGLDAGTRCKFEIRHRATHAVALKSDPYAQRCELRPATASVVRDGGVRAWRDGVWMQERERWDWLHEPLSIYEVHAGSWQRDAGGGFLDYASFAERLADHALTLGFTHIELLPMTEHPLDESWGYQTTGYYAPTARFGAPDDFRGFVEHCHLRGLGVLMDWAPAHFPRDAHALARYDGGPLYEHADPRRGEHRDWGTLIFDYGRNEVRNFLLSSAVYWLEEFHIDGLRVDAVASMLYLDYSRDPGDWTPNEHGGNENLEAVAFLRELNTAVHREFPGALVIAEESTAWPQVTRPVWLGGLGFSMKWNMGWMNDTLGYFRDDPVHRSFHHDQLTFGIMYGFSENFLLPLSHDEVVHCKGSLLGKMPGDAWQQLANLRLLYLYMWTYPGKKLLFMGGEIGQVDEWDHARALAWADAERPGHEGLYRLLVDLNGLYARLPALHRDDFEASGFEWIDCHDALQSVISYVRRAGDERVVVVLNFTPVPRFGYRIGVPGPGRYVELLNSDAWIYDGSNVGNQGGVDADRTPYMGRECSLSITLPPLGGVVFALDGAAC